VGMVSALSLVSATFDQLGLGSLPGRHLVMRGYADIFERKAFDVMFPDLQAEERDALHRARRRHKSAAILLHELGHNLGVSHEQLADTIMNARYSDKSASFTPEARDTMLATVDQRLARKRIQKRAPPAEAHPTLEVGVDANGRASIGGNTIDDATLDELLKMSFADDRNTQVLVKAAPGAPHSAVVKILDRAKAAGLQKLSIGTTTP
jgi:biopolymer transport protein ExbD